MSAIATSGERQPACIHLLLATSLQRNSGEEELLSEQLLHHRNPTATQQRSHPAGKARLIHNPMCSPLKNATNPTPPIGGALLPDPPSSPSILDYA